MNRMRIVLPNDIKAEVIYNYLDNTKRSISFMGNHRRNAYEDIISIFREEDGIIIQLARQGLYDILPESLFHPIDRFDNIPVNEYRERFADEVEQQRIEETDAREFFSLYDKFIFGLSAIVNGIKQTEYSDNGILSDMICDSLPDTYKSNRFICRAVEFTPQASRIRGNITLLTLMLRKIMAEEGLKLLAGDKSQVFTDESPRYNCQILRDENDESDIYLGNTFEENIISFEIRYWNDDYCDASFLDFVKELKEFETFINDYYMGIETPVCFNLSAQTLPVRLSDEVCYNYLNYNTNI